LKLQLALLGGEKRIDAIAKHSMPPLCRTGYEEIAVMSLIQFGNLTGNKFHAVPSVVFELDLESFFIGGNDIWAIDAQDLVNLRKISQLHLPAAFRQKPKRRYGRRIPWNTGKA